MILFQHSAGKINAFCVLTPHIDTQIPEDGLKVKLIYMFVGWQKLLKLRQRIA
jgi:hypothetical protein